MLNSKNASIACEIAIREVWQCGEVGERERALPHGPGPRGDARGLRDDPGVCEHLPDRLRAVRYEAWEGFQGVCRSVRGVLGRLKYCRRGVRELTNSRTHTEFGEAP